MDDKELHRRLVWLTNNKPDELTTAMQRKLAAADQVLTWMQQVVDSGGDYTQAEKEAIDDALKRAATTEEELMSLIRSVPPGNGREGRGDPTL